MACQGLERFEELAERIGIVDVARPVQRENGIRRAGVHSQRTEDRRLLPAMPGGLERVDHHVTDEVDPPWIDAFLQQIRTPTLLGHEEKVCDRVRQDAVDLFRHGTVETAKASFHMGDGDASLHGGDGRRHGGIDVADNEHQVGAR